MTIGKFMLWTLLALFFIFVYLVFTGVPVLEALCIFIYPAVVFTTYFIIMWKQDKKNDNAGDDENGIKD